MPKAGDVPPQQGAVYAAQAVAVDPNGVPIATAVVFSRKQYAAAFIQSSGGSLFFERDCL